MIGIFDSGFGGLSVMKEIVAMNPLYDYIYLGDTARVPYGSRSRETIYQFTTEAVDFLFDKGCDLIIIACNTASAEALRQIQINVLPLKYPGKRVLGVIVPALEEASAVTKNKRVGVLATESTVASRAFVSEMEKHNPEIQVFQNAAPLLVPIVEAGEQDSEVARIMVAKYLAPLLSENVDTVILGCTHYGHLESLIREACGLSVAVVSEGPIVARKLGEYLTRHPEIEAGLRKGGGRTFYTTDLSERFRTLGTSFYGQAIDPIKVSLG